MSMPRYCKPEDVRSYFADMDFSQNTAVTSEKVCRLIDDWSAYINGSINAVCPLPVTDETDLRILSGICARLAAGDVDAILNPSAADGTHKTRDLKREALAMLEAFRSRQNLFTDNLSRVTCIDRKDTNRDY